MQFGGVGRQEAFAEALHSRGFVPPDGWDDWLAVLAFAP
jgi:hypothetical protein